MLLKASHSSASSRGMLLVGLTTFDNGALASVFFDLAVSFSWDQEHQATNFVLDDPLI